MALALGANDERGANNWITPAKVLQAASLIKQGKIYPLSQVLEAGIPLFGARHVSITTPGGPMGGPFGTHVLYYNDEMFSGEIGQVGSQFDGLGHISNKVGNEARYYNGFTQAQVGGSYGLRKLGIHNCRPFFTRGILLDVARSLRAPRGTRGATRSCLAVGEAGSTGGAQFGGGATIAWMESFTAAERAELAPYFTNLDGPVFALVNLPEVVKGALFARYSRSPKSLRRLFLDEFLAPGRLETPEVTHPRGKAGPDTIRAEQLYERVFVEYGDDSVAQLGGVHLACEGASNILTKVIEWGRLMAYLEQSTRYIPYDDQPGGRYRYHVPVELRGVLREQYVATLDHAFATYAAWLPRMRDYYATRFPRGAGESEGVHRMTIRAKALDTLRGLLPAATTSNVGIFGTGQGYEQLLLRMRAHPLTEVRDCAGLMLRELRKVIPAFLRRVDAPERGGAWSTYLADTRATMEGLAGELLADQKPEDRAEVTLTDFDPEGEVKVVAAALYAVSALPDDQLLALARRMSTDERRRVLEAYVGTRANRRHKPGRAFERAGYRFDVLSDYGAFRDLQRHRLLTLEWQALSARHGYAVPEAVTDADAQPDWERVMAESATTWEAIAGAGMPEVAAYAVSLAYRVRFTMQMNAREAMHVIELRTTPQGHASYRRICQAMHRLIAEQAGHPTLAAAMRFADHSEVALGRLEAERAAERRRLGG